MRLLAAIRRIPPFFGLIVPIFTIALDQLTKWLATRAFDLPMNICAINPDVGLQRLHIEVSPIVDLSMYCNQGVSWGLLQGDSDLKRWALFLFAVVMVAVLYNLLSTAKDRLSRWSLSLLIGGAIGNAIDRALLGAVTDFIDASDVYFNYIFNVADSAITIGIIGMLLVIVRDWRDERKAASSAEANTE
jgi:signal peptidase II